jgi:hypothetical protein
VTGEVITDEVLARDIFPAEVLEVGGRVWTKVRCFITSRRMILWGLDAHGIPEIKLEIELAEPLGVFETRAVLTPNQNLEVATLTKGYIINKGRGCGCTGPLATLKALTPPAPWRKG